MRIFYANDGVSTYDSLFLRELSKSHDVSLLTFHHKPSQVPSGVRVISLRDSVREFPAHDGVRQYGLAALRVRAIKRQLSASEPDIVIACFATTYGYYLSQTRFHPFILFVFGSDVLFYPRYAFHRVRIRKALAQADAVLVDSEVQRKACVSLGCERRKIISFPWVDLKEAKATVNAPPGAARTALRREMGWGDDDLVVLSVRSHEPTYSVSTLIEASKKIVAEVPGTRFLLAGGGNLLRTHEELVESIGLKKNYHFTGSLPRNAIPDLMAASDVYVSTSLRDGTSSSLIEAMEAGLPVVVTAIQGNLEWIEDHTDGFVFQPEEPAALANRVLELLQSPSLRRRFGAAARNKVQTRVKWEDNLQSLEKLMRALVGKP